jgi:hypothetical protein
MIAKQRLKSASVTSPPRSDCGSPAAESPLRRDYRSRKTNIKPARLTPPSGLGQARHTSGRTQRSNGFAGRGSLQSTAPSGSHEPDQELDWARLE